MYKKMSIALLFAMVFAGVSVSAVAEEKADKEEDKKLDLGIEITQDMIDQWEKEKFMKDFINNPDLGGGSGGGRRSDGSPNTEDIPPLKRTGPTVGGCGIGGYCGGWRFPF